MSIENIDPTKAVSEVKNYLLDLQNRITAMITAECGGSKFKEDCWQHAEGGGGKTRVMAADAVIEKGGVNFSHVHGASLPTAAISRYPELVNARFQALGVSVVMHPVNPYVPTCHFNVRFFVAEQPEQAPFWWFGGGFDLTPYFPYLEDCVHWHTQAKVACDPFGRDVYSEYKKAADTYFYLKHRQEPRGIGGIFFDEVNAWGFDTCFAFMRSVGEHFIKAYQPIIAKRKQLPYSERESQFQAYRRGRYVEFNLVYDRGTLFGLQFGGRIESILMSLPPRVAWLYDWHPEPGSPEAELYDHYLQARDWV